MSCLDNTDILRIVGGNSFQIAITVKARRVSDGSEIEDFDLSASSPVLNLIHAGEKTRKYFVTQGNQAIISFDGSEGLGYYGMEMSGSYNSEAWRFCIEKVLQLVDTNAKANIPEWSVLVDDTYFIEGTISIYGGGGGGDTVQADWTETNPTSAAFILHKPDLSVYATKTEVASGLEGKQDTIVDLTSIRYGAAAGATAYQKPSSGIPESDMSDGVQSALDKADSAYQLPANGIPVSDMDSEVQASLEKANSAVQTETDPVFSNSPAAEITQADINNWNAKQPAIADLADIREGAAAGATAVQPDEMAQAIDGVEGDIADINAKIPATASNLNQLADKAYVNSSIATNSATYRGSFNLITDLGMNVDATHAQIAGALATAIVTADNNDYAFVQIPDSASTPTVIAKIERYKHNGSGWVYEYDLNNSGFTAAQWAAINSGITSGLVGKLADLPNNSELATLLNGKQNVINDLPAIREGAAAGATAVQPADLTEALNGMEAEIAGLDESKQDTIEDLSTIRSGAAAGATAYQKPSSGIPESDMSEGVQTSLGKADSSYQKPSSGIPSTDMSEGVQAALEKANSAVQTETDPVFSNSPAAEISQNDINSWNAKQSAIADLADIREGAAAGATAVQPDEMAQAIDGVEGEIEDINAKIPTAASNLNQLADKAYVNSSIATNSATYRGSFNLITDLGMNVDATHAQIAGALATAIQTADNNDYAFVQIPDSASTPTVIAKIERYKHNGSGWVYEYDLNNSGFTAAQWAAINSGITSGLVGKLADLPNNSELATLLNGKQNVINDLPAIREGAAAGATAYQKPSSGIPASDMSSTVQQELSKANTAVQTETDPIFSASPAAGITAQNIQTWNGEPAARQAADTALQNSVSTLQTDLAAETSARQSADVALQNQINDLDELYEALTQSEKVVLDAATWESMTSWHTNIIYRVAGTNEYYDYIWDGTSATPTLMATYNNAIDNELSSTSSNLVKNNVIFNAIKSEGVFDISIHNAVGGTPSQYADLATALGTNGANVAVDRRTGGMSVKFINSTTGKYEQWRLMSTTWSTVVSDWQGVDDKLVAGSNNLVKSSGAFEDFNNINLELEEGSAQFGNGNKDGNNTEIGTFNLTKYIRYTIKVKAIGIGSSFSIYLYYDSSHYTLISNVTGNSYEGEFVADYDSQVAYLRIYSLDSWDRFEIILKEAKEKGLIELSHNNSELINDIYPTKIQVDNAGVEEIEIIPAEGKISTTFVPTLNQSYYLVSENYINKKSIVEYFNKIYTHLKSSSAASLYVILTDKEIRGNSQCVQDFQDDIIYHTNSFENTNPLFEINLSRVYAIKPAQTLLIVAFSESKCSYLRFNSSTSDIEGYFGYGNFEDTTPGVDTIWSKYTGTWRCVPPLLVLDNDIPNIAQLEQKLDKITPSDIIPVEGSNVFVYSDKYKGYICGQTYRNRRTTQEEFNVVRVGLNCINPHAVLRIFKADSSFWNAATGRYSTSNFGNYELLYEGIYQNDNIGINIQSVYLPFIVKLNQNDSVFAVVFSPSKDVSYPISIIGSDDGSAGYYGIYYPSTYDNYRNVSPNFGRGSFCCVPVNLSLENVYAENKKVQKDVRRIINIYSSDTDIEILNKMIDAVTFGNVDVYFEPSIYTLQECYIYMRDTLNWTWHMGLPVGNNCRYYLNGSTIISIAPEEEYSDSRNIFDTRVGGNFEMYNGNLIQNGGTYCIHDEMNAFSLPYYHKYHGIVFNESGSSGQFGCGTNFDGRIVFENCSFKSTVTGLIHGPNPNTDNLPVHFELTVMNCYFAGAPITINNKFDVTRDDTTLVYGGNSAPSDISTSKFVDIIKYNNELR